MKALGEFGKKALGEVGKKALGEFGKKALGEFGKKALGQFAALGEFGKKTLVEFGKKAEQDMSQTCFIKMAKKWQQNVLKPPFSAHSHCSLSDALMQNLL